MDRNATRREHRWHRWADARRAGPVIGAAMLALLGLLGVATSALVAGPAGAAGTPAPQTLSQPIKTSSGASLGTYTMTMTTRETDVVANVPATTVQLPAGTYELESCANGVLANTSAASPCPQTTVVTLTRPGTAKIPASSIITTRSLSGQSNAVAGWDAVLLNRGGKWVSYAGSWQGLGSSAIAVPPVGPATTSQLYGSNSNVVLSKAGGGFNLVNMTYETTELTKLAAQGAQVVRTNLPWAFLETTAGNWDPTVVSEYDQYFALARSLGLRVVAELGSTPCWASSAPATVTNGCSSSLNGASYPPSNYANLTAAVTWMMNRWGSAIYGIEPWNEPNWNSSINHAPCANAYWGDSTYVQLLKTTYAAVKSVDPAILVGAATLSLPDTTYLDCLYNDGIKGNYDVIDVHPYQVDFQQNPATTGNPLTPFPLTDSAMYGIDTGMENLHGDMLAHGDNSPVWITETGFSTCQSTANHLCVSTSQQSQWLTASFQMIARWSFVSLALSYNAADANANLSNWNDNFGLMDNSLAPKPSLTGLGGTWSCLHAGTC